MSEEYEKMTVTTKPGQENTKLRVQVTNQETGEIHMDVSDLTGIFTFFVTPEHEHTARLHGMQSTLIELLAVLKGQALDRIIDGLDEDSKNLIQQILKLISKL